MSLYLLPVDFGYIAQSFIGKLRKDEVVHLTSVFVYIAPAYARPTEIRVLLGENIGCHELRVITGEGGEDKFFTVVLIYRIGWKLVFWEEIGKERGLRLTFSFFWVPKLLIYGCKHVNTNRISCLLVLLGGRYKHILCLSLTLIASYSLGCLGIGTLHRADHIITHTHESETLEWCQLSDGIRLNGLIPEIEFCYHFVLLYKSFILKLLPLQGDLLIAMITQGAALG